MSAQRSSMYYAVLFATGALIATVSVQGCTSSASSPQCTKDADCDSLLKVPAGTGVCTNGTCSERPSISEQDGGEVPDAEATPDVQTLPVDAAPDAPKPTPQEVAYCAAIVSHASCNDAAASTCTPLQRCLAALMVPTAAEHFGKCHASPACIGEDVCINAAGKAEGGMTAVDYAMACANRHNACKGGFSDDGCSEAAFAFTGVGPAMAACLALDCGKIQGCFDTALQKLNACK